MLIEMKNDLTEMSKVRDAVSRFSEENHLNEEIQFTLDLCLEELITNIIKYAYQDKAEHSIQIKIGLHDDLLVLEIRDDGKPFDPTGTPAPDFDAPLEVRQIGGLGIHLVRSYVNSMDYKREGNH